MFNVQLFDSNGQLRATREFQTGSEACCYGENWIMLREGNAFEVEGVFEEGPMRVEAFGQGRPVDTYSPSRHESIGVEPVLMDRNPRVDASGELDLEKYEAFKKTLWGKAVTKSLDARAEIEDLITTGKSRTHVLKGTLLKALKDGIEGAWGYVSKTDRILSQPTKPIYSVTSTCINCRPSKACARFCYAYGGQGMYPNVIIFAELVDYLARTDPVRLGRLIAEKFKKYRVGQRQMDEIDPETEKIVKMKDPITGKLIRDPITGKTKNKKITVKYDLHALRFFDRGEGADHWVDVIAEVNRQGVRTHIFSKRPEFLSKVDPWNVRLLSVDRTNFDITKGNDLPVGFNYTNADEIQMIESLGDRVQLILPVKFKKKDKQAEMLGHIKALEAVGGGKYKTRMCPIDSRKMVIGQWNCGKCDVGRGTGCYYLQPSAEVKYAVAS